MRFARKRTTPSIGGASAGTATDSGVPHDACAVGLEGQQVHTWRSWATSPRYWFLCAVRSRKRGHKPVESREPVISHWVRSLGGAHGPTNQDARRAARGGNVPTRS